MLDVENWNLEPDRFPTVAASVQPCLGVPWQLNKTMKRAEGCENGKVRRVTLTAMEDIIMGGKSKGIHRKIIINARVWHSCDVRIQYLSKKINSYHWATNYKQNKRTAMYSSTRKDDAMGSKLDVVALFKISALGIKSRQQNIETQTSPIGIRTWNENAQSSAQMSPGFSMTCKYKQNSTNLCFLFNPAGLFKQLDTHHIEYFVY